MSRTEEGTWKGYPQFQHIESDVLRAWNQSSIFFNLIGDMGLNQAKEYVASLPKAHRVEVMDIFQRIKTHGYAPVRAAVNRELQQGEVFDA